MHVQIWHIAMGVYSNQMYTYTLYIKCIHAYKKSSSVIRAGQKILMLQYFPGALTIHVKEHNAYQRLSHINVGTSIL